MKKIYKKTYKIHKSKKLQKKKKTLKKTQRTLTNKKVKQKNILYGGSGAPITTKPRIVISSRGKFEDIVPIVLYLKWNEYVDTIYAGGVLPINTSTIKYIKASSKPKNINDEIISMNSSPFVIYIDDDNEIAKTLSNYDKTKFQIYIGKYTNTINNTMTSIIEILNDSILDLTQYNCMFISLPYETSGITNILYYNIIEKYFNDVKKLYKNNILVVFDFDCTLTTKHLYKSINSGFPQYTFSNASAFNTAFITPGNNDTLKQNEIDKYFGDATNKNSNLNIKKIEDLFDIITTDTVPESSTSFCNKIKK